MDVTRISPFELDEMLDDRDGVVVISLGLGEATRLLAELGGGRRVRGLGLLDELVDLVTDAVRDQPET